MESDISLQILTANSVFVYNCAQFFSSQPSTSRHNHIIVISFIHLGVISTASMTRCFLKNSVQPEVVQLSQIFS